MKEIEREIASWQFELPRMDDFYFAAQARWDGGKKRKKPEKEEDITYRSSQELQARRGQKGRRGACRTRTGESKGEEERKRGREKERDGGMFGFRFGEGCSGVLYTVVSSSIEGRIECYVLRRVVAEYTADINLYTL